MLGGNDNISIFAIEIKENRKMKALLNAYFYFFFYFYFRNKVEREVIYVCHQNKAKLR